MKKLLLSFGVLLMALLSSCSGSKEPSALEGLCETLNGEFKELATDDYMLFENFTVEYAEGTVDVKVEFANSTYCPAEFSDALVQFIVSQYMKEHPGERLDTFVNTLSKEKGTLRITIEGCGESKTFEIPANRVVKLVKLKPMELSYTEARDNVTDIMAKRCEKFKKFFAAKSVDFAVVNGFAQYTFTFEKSTGYARMKQSELNSDIIRAVIPVLVNFGNEEPFVVDLLKIFKIDGYRFVYENEKDKYILKSSLPWRVLDSELEKKNLK